MALIKDITRGDGGVTKYHKIQQIHLNFLDLTATIEVASYVDEAARRANKAARISTVTYQSKTMDEFEFNPRYMSYYSPQGLAYKLLSARKGAFQDAESDEKMIGLLESLNNPGITYNSGEQNLVKDEPRANVLIPVLICSIAAAIMGFLAGHYL